MLMAALLRIPVRILIRSFIHPDAEDAEILCKAKAHLLLPAPRLIAAADDSLSVLRLLDRLQNKALGI